MNYQEQIKKVVQEFYDVTKAFASSRHYTFSYWWVESNFGLDLNDEQTRSDVRKMSYSDGFCDLIETLDFDNDKQEVLIMIWESNNKKMKKYTIENYEEFSREALDAPPIEEFMDGTIDELKWYEENKIIITKGNHQIELDYNADNVSAVDGALREMYEVEMDIRSATTANTVGSEYRPAELKDILRIAIQNDWDEWGWRLPDFGTFIREFISKMNSLSDVMCYYEVIQKDYKDAADRCKCDFSKLDMSTMRIINHQVVRNAIGNLIGTDKEILYGMTEDNKSSDIVFVIDYTLKLMGGELIGWFYGQDDIDEAYINELIEKYKKNLFGEEN